MIAESRTALAAIITSAGVTCLGYVPERVTPPIAVVEPSSDWVSTGEVFGEYQIGYDVTLVTQTASHSKATSLLDEMLEDVLVAVGNATGFHTGSVSAPTILQISNAEYLSVALTIYQTKRL
jgi:hypothetical protein